MQKPIVCAKAAMGVLRTFVAFLALLALSWAQGEAETTKNVNLAFITSDPNVQTVDKLACTVVINDDAIIPLEQVTSTVAKAAFTAITQIAGVSLKAFNELCFNSLIQQMFSLFRVSNFLVTDHLSIQLRVSLAIE